MFWRLIMGLFTAMLSVTGETAKLECTADSVFYPRGKDAFVMQFRVGAAAKMHVTSATIFLHVAGGGVPAQVELALVERAWTEANAKSLKPPTAWRPAATKKQPNGWVTLEVPVGYAQALVDGKAQGIAMRGGFRPHQRESGQFAPYMNVEGTK